MHKNGRDNVIYVSHGYDTDKQYGRTIFIDEMHFITENPWPATCENVEITFKNRHMPDFIPANLSCVGENRYRIDSHIDVQGIAPGQFAVIYDRDSHICYGSGVITL